MAAKVTPVWRQYAGVMERSCRYFPPRGRRRRGWPREWVLSGFDRHKFYMVGHRMKFYEIITRDISCQVKLIRSLRIFHRLVQPCGDRDNFLVAAEIFSTHVTEYACASSPLCDAERCYPSPAWARQRRTLHRRNP